jgi:hypothetical protein
MTVLTIAFFIAKTTGTVSWSWIWVFSPFWIGFSIWLGTIVFVLLIALVLTIIDFIIRK